MLSNFDIEGLAIQLDLPLVGVYSKDELKNILPSLGTYIINQQSSTDGDGTHWTLAKIYCDEDRPGAEESPNHKICKALVFDSFGVGCSTEVSEFLKRFKPIAQSTRQIQDLDSNECGWFCLCLDYSLEHKQHDDTYLEDFRRFLEMWSNNTRQNSVILKNFFKKTPIGGIR